MRPDNQNRRLISLPAGHSYAGRLQATGCSRTQRHRSLGSVDRGLEDDMSAPKASVIVFLALPFAACWHAPNPDAPPSGAATDGALTAWAAEDGVHVFNHMDVAMALAVYDRAILLARSSDRDACMMSPVAQCPSVLSRGVRVIPYLAVIEGRRQSDSISVRYWPAGDASRYPQDARTISIARRRPPG